MQDSFPDLLIVELCRDDQQDLVKFPRVTERFMLTQSTKELILNPPAV